MDKVAAMKGTYRELGLDCLFMLGGNGSTKTANRLAQEGLNVIALPKTIDNDTWGTDITFGFTSAVEHQDRQPLGAGGPERDRAAQDHRQ